jgi:hypothetical protein
MRVGQWQDLLKSLHSRWLQIGIEVKCRGENLREDNYASCIG